MICSFCGSEVKDGDKFCMVCGTAVEAMNAAVTSDTPSIEMPEVKAPDIPEVTVGEPVAPAPEGAYFADQQNAPAPAPEPMPAFTAPQPETQNVYAQPVYAQPQPASGQPVYAQPVYAQPQPQPAAGQPVYAQPQPAPVYITPGPMINGELVNTTPHLVFGIVSLCLALSFYLGIGGIILGAIGLSKSNYTLSTCGCLDGKGKVGRHLSRAGLIIGIVMTVILAIVIIAAVVEHAI